jgi:hypothetical protein
MKVAKRFTNNLVNKVLARGRILEVSCDAGEMSGIAKRLPVFNRVAYQGLSQDYNPLNAREFDRLLGQP